MSNETSSLLGFYKLLGFRVSTLIQAQIQAGHDYTCTLVALYYQSLADVQSLNSSSHTLERDKAKIFRVQVPCTSCARSRSLAGPVREIFPFMIFPFMIVTS